MAAKKQEQKETSTPLIITMIFFILLSIGLGVATYYGFAEQTALKDAKKKSDNETKKANDERDFYKFQAWVLRKYIGVPFEGAPAEADAQEAKDKLKSGAEDTVASGKGKLASGKFGDNLSEEKKREVTELQLLLAQRVEAKDKCGAWDVNGNVPATTYEAQLAAERKKIADLELAMGNLKTELEKEQKARQAATDSLKATQDAYDTKFKDLAAQRQKDLDNYAAEVNKYIQEAKNFTAKRPDEGAKYAKMVDDANKERALFAKENKELKEKIGILQSRLDVKEEQKPINAKILGEVVSVQVNGKKAFINIGSAHGVKPQQTFAVFALDPNGKPRPDPKASVEVVNVVKERLSEVIITTMYSKDRDPYTDRLKQIGVGDAKNVDPVVKGDVLINPVWNPDAKIHVAISGVIDLKGDGLDNMEAFIRALEKQNVIVDAYIDTRDMTIKGPGISQKTEYLVIGSQPYTTDPSGKSKKAENLEKKMEEMRTMAQKYGLTPKKATRFLEETGYRMESRVEN